MSKRFNGSFKGIDKVSSIEDISSMSNGVFDLKSQYTFSLPQEIIVPWQYGGTVNGYTINSEFVSPYKVLHIDKFPFASETDVSNVGTANSYVTDVGSASSDVAGYILGGDFITSPPYYSPNIYKFPFASEGLSTYIGSLSLYVGNVASAANQDYALAMGGATFPPSGTPSTAARVTSRIQKLSFATDTEGAATVGYLGLSVRNNRGYSTQEDGYSVAGYRALAPSPGSTEISSIYKCPFAATSGTVASVGNLTVIRSAGNPLQSDTHGYYLEDGTPATAEKFPFAVPITSAILSDLDISAVPQKRCTTTSTTTGYLAYAPAEFHKLNYASDTSIAQITASSPWTYRPNANPTGFKV